MCDNEVVGVIIEELRKVVCINDHEIMRFSNGMIAVEFDNVMFHFEKDNIYYIVHDCGEYHVLCFEYVDWVRFVEFVWYTVFRG